MKPQIHVVTLGVAEIKRARKFYEEGLGWPVSSASQDAIVFFQLGAIVLALYPRNRLAEDAAVPSSGSGFRGVIGWSLFQLYPDG